MEINVSYFGVLHWQQWQTPASTPRLFLANVELFLNTHKKDYS